MAGDKASFVGEGEPGLLGCELSAARLHSEGGRRRNVRSSLGHGWNLAGVRRGVFLGVLFGVLLAEPLALFLPFFFPMAAEQRERVCR